MGRWKSRGGKSQGGEEKKWEDQRREGVRRKKMQLREKVGKPRFTVFLQWFVALEGRKAEPAGHMRDEKLHAIVARSTFSKSICTKQTRFGPLLEVAMSKKCTPLWREAHVQVKSVKNPQFQTTFGSCDVEKVHAVVARSTFPSQKWKTLRGSGHFLSFRCRHRQQQQLLQQLQQLQLRYICTTLHYTKRHYTNYSYSHNYNYATLHYTTLH